MSMQVKKDYFYASADEPNTHTIFGNSFTLIFIGNTWMIILKITYKKLKRLNRIHIIKQGVKVKLGLSIPKFLPYVLD
jgi:hypothetical protein